MIRTKTALGVFVGLAILAAASVTPAFAAAVPVDVSGPVDGSGPGLSVSPGDGIAEGSTVGLFAENLPTALEAAAWVDDGDFAGEVGTYTGNLSVAQCGNADAAGAPLAPAAFDAAQHCDGGDARSAAFTLSGPAANGGLLISITPRGGFGVDEGIGTALATCVPVAAADITAGTAIPCSYLVRDAAGPVGAVFSGTASFTFAEPPELNLVSITGQLAGAQAARAGDSLVVAGTGWDPSSGLSAELCDPADESSCDASSSTVGLSVDAAGNLLGSVEVFPLNTTGLRVLKISQTSNGQRALVPIRILGVRSIAIDPAGGSAGSPIPVNITGTDFDPLQTVTVTGTDGVNPTSDIGAGTVDSEGVLTGSIIITSPATVGVMVTEDDAPTTDGASTAFAISSQIITGEVTITGGALTVTQSGSLVEMSPITLSGQSQQSSGEIQSVTVGDMRGSLSGWTVTATATDWVDITVPDPSNPIPGHFFPADNLSWTPSCTPAPGSTADPFDVTAGPVAQLDPSTAATLCSAAPGGGGGGWVTGASLSLLVPASVAAGNYRATLTIVAV